MLILSNYFIFPITNAENHKLAHDVLRHKVSVILGFDPAEVLKMEVVKEIQSLKLAIEDHQENFDCKYFNNNQQ